MAKNNNQQQLQDDSRMDTSKSHSPTENTMNDESREGENFEDDLEKQGGGAGAATPEEPVTVQSLAGYEGANEYQRLDAFLATHDVAMVNRSWCLFSIDAMDFLVRLGVKVHSFEVDQHPHGRDLVRYLKKKYEHDTSPWIFIKGNFVGGYEDINCLYSQGTLQTKYLNEITNTEGKAAEKMAEQATTKPLFWFPEKVNANAIRATGVLTSFMALASAVISIFTPYGQIIAYYLVLDFILRIFGGGRVSPVGMVAQVLVSWMEPNPRSGRAKQFACLCGFMFSFLGSLFYVIPFTHHTYIGSAFMAMLALACGMEGFIDFCLGCVFFRIGLQLGVFPK